MKKLVYLFLSLFVVMSFAGCASFFGGSEKVSDQVANVCADDLWKDDQVQGAAAKAGINLEALVQKLCAVNEVVRKYEVIDKIRGIVANREAAVEAAEGAGMLGGGQ